MFYNKDIWHNCFNYRKRYWYKNLRYIPLYIRRIHYLIKNGYDEMATWEFSYWFADKAREILTQYNKTRHGTPIVIDDYPFDDDDSEVTQKKRKDNENKWNEIVERMIFLLGEINEDTCQKKNPYDEEWSEASDEFTSKYGLFGQGLMTEEEKQMAKEKGYSVMHFMRELPEYQDISKKHRDAEIDLDKYRDKCKDEFFKLFSKYYYALWD